VHKWPLSKLFVSRDSIQKYINLLQITLAVYAIYVLPFNYTVIGLSLAWFLIMLHFGHNTGLHRYFSHSSFKLNKFWHIVITFASTLVAFGSPLGYAVIHKTHHRYSDTPDDPHQPSKPIKTFLFNFNTSDEKVSPLYAKKLRDKWVSFTHNYYLLLILLFYSLLILIDTTLALTYNIGISLILVGTGWVNIIGHTSNFIAYRNFDTKDKSNNDLVSGYIFGEWHNNHHSTPNNWSQQVKWWELDIPKYIILAIKS